jgi:hypothetical protein
VTDIVNAIDKDIETWSRTIFGFMIITVFNEVGAIWIIICPLFAWVDIFSTWSSTTNGEFACIKDV